MATEVTSNEDLLREILLRLPVKPLLRFKCVSKHWLALISEPRFCHSHTLRQYHASRPFPSALLLGTRSSFQIIPLKGSVSSSKSRYIKVPGMSIFIKQSCNGLLLLAARPFKNPNPNKVKASHFVYNPTTNQFVVVNFPTPEFGSSVISLFLSFEPLRSSHYKVISIRIRDLSKSSLRDYVVNVYSSETGSWSDPGVSFTAPDNSKVVYCNGAIYWYSKNDMNPFFDVENQCFKTFPMPLEIDHEKVRRFGESGGYLHLVVQSFLNHEFDILELKENRSGWSVRFHVNLHPMLVACPHWSSLALLFRFNNISCFVRQKREVDSILVFFVGGRIVAYNIGKSTYRDLTFLFFNGRSRFDYFDYYENLSWVGRPSNAD